VPVILRSTIRFAWDTSHTSMNVNIERIGARWRRHVHGPKTRIFTIFWAQALKAESSNINLPSEITCVMVEGQKRHSGAYHDCEGWLQYKDVDRLLGETRTDRLGSLSALRLA